MSTASSGVPRRRGRPPNVVPSEEYRTRLESIVSAAAEVFRSHSYDAATLDHVAAALGLGKASLYYYVNKKSDLLRLVFDRAITAALTEVETLAHITDPRERLVALIRHQVRLVLGEPSLFAVFFDQRTGLEKSDLAQINLKERRYLRQFVLAVEAAMEAEVIPPGDPRMVANSIIGLTSWSYKWFDPHRDSPEEIADICCALIVR